MTRRTRDGVLVPDGFYTEAIAHQAGGGISLLALFDHNPTCGNCGGAERVGLYRLFGNGSKSVRERGAHHFHDGLWYRADLTLYPCPVCNTEDHQLAIQARLDVSGLEPAEYDWQLSYLTNMSGKEMALGAVHTLLAETKRPAGWIFLYGGYGLGKSGLLKSAVAAMCRIGVSARYCTAEDMLTEIYELIERSKRNDDEAETIRQLINRYEKYQLLAIDELGPDRAPDTQFALSKLFNVIDTRYNRRSGLATMLASNSTPDQLLKHPQWRYLESRTRDGLRILIGGKDLRGQPRRDTQPEAMPVPYKD